MMAIASKLCSITLCTKGKSPTKAPDTGEVALHGKKQRPQNTVLALGSQASSFQKAGNGAPELDPRETNLL